MSQSLIQDTFYTFLWSIVLLLWLLLGLIYSLFSLCSVKPSSAHKLYVAIAKRKGRGPSNLGPRLPLRLTSRASKKRDLEKGSHAIGFLYRCRTFPIFNLFFFSCKQKISLATRCITPNLVQKDNIANSNKIRIPPPANLKFFLQRNVCQGGQRLYPRHFSKIVKFWVPDFVSFQWILTKLCTFSKFGVIVDLSGVTSSLPKKFQTALWNCLFIWLQ